MMYFAWAKIEKDTIKNAGYAGIFNVFKRSASKRIRKFPICMWSG